MSNPFGADDGDVNPFVSRDNYGVVKEFEGAGVIRQGTHARGDTTYAAPDEVAPGTYVRSHRVRRRAGSVVHLVCFGLY